MTESLIARFERAVEGTEATIERTTAAAFDETLGRALDGPAVGVELPFDGLSLESHPITTRPTPAELESATIGVTPAGPGIAEYGTVVVTSDEQGAEQISLYPETHIAVLAASDILPTLAVAIEQVGDAIAQGLTSAVLTTGPSATADMGAPVYGAHGPSSVHVLVLEDR